MYNFTLKSHIKFNLLLMSLCFCHSISANIISTAVTAEAYTVSYPEPDNGWREHDSGTKYASVLTRSNLYDTSVYADSYIDVDARGVAFLAMTKYTASAASGSTTISYQLDNNSSVAQKFALRFSPLFGYLQAYCADPEDLFKDGNGSRLPCVADDFAISSYDARIWLNDELIWSSMASVRSDMSGVDVVTDGAVLGTFDAGTYSYRWDTQWFNLPLGIFEPNEIFNLVYSVDVLTDGQVSLQGAAACEPFNCPYSENIAFAEYGSPEFSQHIENIFQISSRAFSVGEPANLGLLILGGLTLVRLKGSYKQVKSRCL